MNKHLYIVMMAGGEGVRFFPISTPEKPKQFLSFWGDRTFIQQTFDRVKNLAPVENIYVATNKKYIDLVKAQLPEISPENIIGEPEKKNTAPCIAYTSAIIAERDKEAVMTVLPCDHLITNKTDFIGVIERAIYIATTRDVLVTLGIQPNWPADCYGYIKRDKLIEDDPDGKWHAYTVDRFIEKPSTQTAQMYIDEGEYFWNSGMFVWKASFILHEIEKYLPEMKTLVDKYSSEKLIELFFHESKSISIDYGVMERSTRVVTVPCNIGWSDIGTWQSLYHLSKNGTIQLEPHVEKEMKSQIGNSGA